MVDDNIVYGEIKNLTSGLFWLSVRFWTMGSLVNSKVKVTF